MSLPWDAMACSAVCDCRISGHTHLRFGQIHLLVNVIECDNADLNNLYMIMAIKIRPRSPYIYSYVYVFLNNSCLCTSIVKFHT